MLTPFIISISSDIASARSVLHLMDENDYLVNQYAFRGFAEFYARHGDIDHLQQILQRCNQENAENFGWVLLQAIKELAKNNHTTHIASFLPLLPSSYNIEQTIRSAIALYVENNLTELLLDICITANIDMAQYAKYLINEMVYAKTNATEVNRAWHRLQSLNITFDTNFSVYEPAINSQSPELIEATLDHMYSNGMQMPDKVFKGLIRLSAKNGSNHLLETIDSLCQRYKFDPQISFVSEYILPALDWKANATATLSKLYATKLSNRTTLLAVVHSSLRQNDIRTALAMATTNLHPINIEPIIVGPLLRAYHVTGDTVNFVRFIRLIQSSIEVYGTSDGANVRLEQETFIEQIIAAIVTDDQFNSSVKNEFLSALVKQGVIISNSFASELITFNNETNSQIVSLLRKLAETGETTTDADTTEDSSFFHLFEECMNRNDLDGALDVLGQVPANIPIVLNAVKMTHRFLSLVKQRVFTSNNVDFVYMDYYNNNNGGVCNNSVKREANIDASSNNIKKGAKIDKNEYSFNRNDQNHSKFVKNVKNPTNFAKLDQNPRKVGGLRPWKIPQNPSKIGEHSWKVPQSHQNHSKIGGKSWKIHENDRNFCESGENSRKIPQNHQNSRKIGGKSWRILENYKNSCETDENRGKSIQNAQNHNKTKNVQNQSKVTPYHGRENHQETPENTANTRLIFEPLLEQYAMQQSGGIVSMPQQLSIELIQLINRTISVHIKNRNFTRAIETFERIVELYGIVPMAELLFIALIENRQMEFFNQIHDIYRKQCGEEATKRALAHAYIDCEMYNRRRIADDLLAASEKLHYDRYTLYEVVLEIYQCRNNLKRAMALLDKCENVDKLMPNGRMLEILAKIEDSSQ